MILRPPLHRSKCLSVAVVVSTHSTDKLLRMEPLHQLNQAVHKGDSNMLRLDKYLCSLMLLSQSLMAQTATRLPTATYRATSSSAIGTTGDLQTAPNTLVLSGHSLALVLVQSLDQTSLKSAAAIFSVAVASGSSGALYRLHVPAATKFRASNTLCGAHDSSYALVLLNGKQLELAIFDGNKLPNLAPLAIRSSTTLCGTFEYSQQ